MSYTANATAVLLSTILLTVSSPAKSLNVATLTFSKVYPSEHEQVDVKCDSAIVGNRNDLSKLIFYAVNTDYKYTLQRNCVTNEILYDEDAFGHTIDWSEGNDGKIYLIWTQLTTKYNGLQFQCSISKCTTEEIAVSDTTNITVLPDPAEVILQPLNPYVTADTYNGISVPFRCSGFVGYPGGKLEILANESTEGAFNLKSIANFSANVKGFADGKAYYLMFKNQSDIEKTRTNCVASNTINQNVQTLTVSGSNFKAAYPPKEQNLYYNGQILEQDSRGYYMFKCTAPLINDVLKCTYDDSLPASTIALYQDEIVYNYGVQLTRNSSDSYTLNFNVRNFSPFKLNFKCKITYVSDAVPSMSMLLLKFIQIEVS